MQKRVWRIHGSLMRYKGATQRVNGLMLRPDNLYLVESWQDTPVAYIAKIDNCMFTSYPDYESFLAEWSDKLNDFDL